MGREAFIVALRGNLYRSLFVFLINRAKAVLEARPAFDWAVISSFTQGVLVSLLLVF